MNEDRFSWIETWKDRSAEFVDWAYDRLSQLWRVAEQAFDWVRRRPWAMRTLIVLSSLAASTFFAALFRPLISPESEFMLYLPAVAVSGLFAGVPAGFAASIAGAWLAMYMFIFPYRDALTNRGQETAALLLYLMASALILLLNRVQEAQKQQIREFAETLERKVAERTADLRKANEELQSFCYSISHDLRAPMRNIVGSSRMIIEDAADKLDGESKDNLLSIAASANRLAQLVDDLLNHARIGHSSMSVEKISLSAMVQGIADELIEQGWPFPIEVAVEPHMTAVCDPELMRMALYNLLENACKYAHRERTLVIEVGETRHRGWPVYFVRDNGIGFDMRYVDKIFQPFQRLHRDSDYPGTGIGLANVQRAVERHGGKVWAEGAPGKGATFYLTLGRLRSGHQKRAGT